MNTDTVKLQFGVNPFDRVSHKQARYHVRNAAGFIVAKYDYGYIADQDAWKRSDKEGPYGTEGGSFEVFDTREQSILCQYADGVEQIAKEQGA